MAPSRATRIDVIAGGLVTAIAASSLWQAADLDTGTLRSFGPGMLPTILATLLLVCGAALLAIGLLRNDPRIEHFQANLRGPGFIGLAVLVFAVTVEGTELGGLTLPRWGVAIAGPLTVILAGYASVEADLRDLAAVGCGLTAFCLALFNDILGMDIPVVPGMLEATLIDALGMDAVLRASYGLLAASAGLLAMFRPAAPSDA